MKNRYCVSFVSILMLCLISCKPACYNEIAQKYLWKYGGGYYMGDVISFNSYMDTKLTVDNENHIYKDGKELGIITNANENRLEIESLTKEKGTYVMFSVIK